MLARSSPQPAISSPHSLLSTPTSPPTVTHVLCCPDCSFMSLQATLLARHVFDIHGLLTVQIYRCTLCGAASTQKELMREHSAIYHHGFEGDCNIFEMLTTEVLSGAPLITSSSEGRNNPLAGAAVALVGSKKRKSTVPERVRCHTVFPEAEAMPMTQADEAPQTPKVKKPRKAASLGGYAIDEARSINKMLLQPHQLTLKQQMEQKQHAAEQIMALESKTVETELECDEGMSESALDLSMKSPTVVQMAKTHQVLPQPRQQPQQKQRKRKDSLFGAAIGELHLTQHLGPQRQLEQQLQQLEHQQQRQNFTCGQNARLLQWFVEHKSRPYPSADDTKVLACATGLSYSQVKKWFANKRMRSKAVNPATSQRDNEEGSSMALSPTEEFNCSEENQTC